MHPMFHRSSQRKMAQDMSPRPLSFLLPTVTSCILTEEIVSAKQYSVNDSSSFEVEPKMRLIFRINNPDKLNFVRLPNFLRNSPGSTNHYGSLQVKIVHRINKKFEHHSWVVLKYSHVIRTDIPKFATKKSDHQRSPPTAGIFPNLFAVNYCCSFFDHIYSAGFSRAEWKCQQMGGYFTNYLDLCFVGGNPDSDRCNHRSHYLFDSLAQILAIFLFWGSEDHIYHGSSQ